LQGDAITLPEARHGGGTTEDDPNPVPDRPTAGKGRFLGVPVRIKRHKTTPKRQPKGGKGRDVAQINIPAGEVATFKELLKKAFKSNKYSAGAKAAQVELLEAGLRQAKRGNFFFWSKLIDIHESKDFITEETLQDFIEKVYVTVRRHVERLEGGKEAMVEIARDLQKQGS
jgi:hypothetical protein